MVWTIVVAGGTGRRIGGIPKQYRKLGGTPVLVHAVRAMAAGSEHVVVVADDPARVAAAGVAAGTDGVAAVVRGGTDRRASVAAGLRAVPASVETIAVHDAARPLATTALLRRAVTALAAGVDGVVPALALDDTVKEVDDHGIVVRTLDRERVVVVQTPQVFRARALRAAHEAVPGPATDDAYLVEAAGGVVVTVPGEPHNFKLTRPEDLEAARSRVAGESERS